MARNRVHQAINGTITASGNSGALPNLGESKNPTVVAILDVSGTVSGTSPSMTITVEGSYDGVRFYTLATFTAVTAALSSPQRQIISNVLEPYLQVSWSVTGTTPSFGGASCELIMSSPDA